jgi:hypothetical protein
VEQINSQRLGEFLSVLRPRNDVTRYDSNRRGDAGFSDGAQMPDYQLYIRDGYGELLGSALQVRASSDADAIAEAATLRKQFAADLRDGRRLVKRFERRHT